MAYGYYRVVTIDPSKVPGDLTDHPVTFNSTRVDLATTGNGGKVTSAAGYDIVFSASTNGSSPYPHEIEKYVAATGEFVAHVEVPAVDSAVDTVFYIVFGDSGVTTSQENITGVWDANFKMVQHMKDATTSTILDSTSNNNDGTKKAANDPIEAAAKIGLGQDFERDNSEYLTVPNAAIPWGGNVLSFELWFKSESTGINQSFSMTGRTGKGFLLYLSRAQVVISKPNVSDLAHAITEDTSWHYLVGTSDGGGLDLYLEGAPVANNADASNWVDPDGDAVYIGAYYSGGALQAGWYNDGLIDEIRISDIARSTDYITATHNNQSAPATFYALSAVLSLAGTLTPAGAITRKTLKPLAGALTMAGAVATARRYFRSLAGTLTSAGTIARKTAKSFAGTLTSAGAVGKKMLLARTVLAGTLTSAGTVVKKTGKALAGTLTSAGAIAKKATKSLAGTVTSAGTLARKTAKGLAGTLTSAGALARKVSLSFAGTSTSAGALVRKTAKSFAGTLTSAGALSRKAKKGLAGALASSGALARKVAKSFAGTLAPAGAVGKKMVLARTSLAGTLTSAGTLTRKAKKSLAGTLTSAGALVRKTKKRLAGVLSLAGALQPGGRFYRTLTGTLTMSGTVTKKTKKVLAGALSFIGTLVSVWKGRRRWWIVWFEDRTLTVEAEDRTWKINAEDRTLTVGEE